MKKDRRATRARQFATVTIAVLTAILAACSDAASPSAPADRSIDPAMDQALTKAKALSELLPQSFVAQGLLRQHALQAAITVTSVITSSKGGTIEIPDADFELEVPAGAIAGDSLTVSVTAMAGSAVAYDFQPHGTTFRAPLRFVQRLKHTNLKNVRLLPGFHAEIGGVYFSDAGFIDPTTGIAVVTEVTPGDVTGTVIGDQLSFPIWHFSGYMASTGRH